MTKPMMQAAQAKSTGGRAPLARVFETRMAPHAARLLSAPFSDAGPRGGRALDAS
jgi:hypothetical protein